MEVSYLKNLHYNYMVISQWEGMLVEYCIKVLQYQEIKGILPMEQRMIDGKLFFYYNITSKEAIYNLYHKLPLSYNQVRKLFMDLSDIIERAYEYLFIEDDFVLLPEYIFMDDTTSSICLCYLPGYGKNIGKQICSLLEYLMNKVDYKDKEAVLLVYHLYAISREDKFILNHLSVIIQEAKDSSARDRELFQDKLSKDRISLDRIFSDSISLDNTSLDNTSLNSTSVDIATTDIATPDNASKINKSNLLGGIDMTEDKWKKVKSFKEKLCLYPFITYLQTGICLMMGVVSFAICIFSKVIYNSIESRIEYSKMFLVLIILFCVESYVINKIWNKKSAIQKEVTKKTNIDPFPLKVPKCLKK